MKPIEAALTFDDVLLEPAYSEVLPKSVTVTSRLTREISLNIPLLSSAMDTVTEARLAIAMAQEGGMGIIHKNLSIQAQANEVKRVKKFESGVVKDPLTVTPNTTIKELIAITQANNISGMPVVEGQALLGIVTSRDIRFETAFDKPVFEVMTPKEKLVTVLEGTPRDEVIALLNQNRIEKMLVVNDAFQLRGMITVRDILKAKEKPNACKDNQGQLRVGAAVGVTQDTPDRIAALVKAGVDVIVVDTAHGHSKGVLDQIKWIKDQYPNLQVIGGNIATAQGAIALVEAGADGVKVGIGPASICTTRIISGVGVPQITAITQAVNAIKDSGVPVIADGGIRYSGDMCKAIAAGADSVMIGGLFAGTEEAPGEVELYKGRTYKSYRGMGSLGAMAQTHGSSDRYFQGQQALADKLVPEGVEGRVSYKGSLLTIVHQLIGGLRSCMGYVGCGDIPTLQTHAKFVRVTAAGVRENHVHDVTITKEAPNYHQNG